MRSAFYAMNGPDMAPNPDGGVFSVRMLDSDIAGMDRASVVRRVERLTRAATGERLDVQRVAADLPVEFETAEGEWIALVNRGETAAGWVVLNAPGSALVRLSPGRTVLCDRAHAGVVYVPPGMPGLLPDPPEPQWGARTEGAVE
ncbi:hypothetical protein ACGFNX_37185 [Streptomyces sp. NPDC048723]|uniref:hypothetical protein n=1 Tax=Streptomyces sp. NPDC048723 TaxID=3365589 RepID=UPI00372070E2